MCFPFPTIHLPEITTLLRPTIFTSSRRVALYLVRGTSSRLEVGHGGGRLFGQKKCHHKVSGVFFSCWNGFFGRSFRGITPIYIWEWYIVWPVSLENLGEILLFAFQAFYLGGGKYLGLEKKELGYQSHIPVISSELNMIP